MLTIEPLTLTASYLWGGGVFGSNPKIKYLSLDKDLNFHIHLGIRSSKTGEKLLYYYLYHE